MTNVTIVQDRQDDLDHGSAAPLSSPHDPLNQKIIRYLQSDGRMSFRSIAELLDISEGTVRNRVAGMKDAGVLSIVAVIDPTALQYRTDAMIGINVASGFSPAQVAERLGAHPEVVYALWVSGRYDLLVEIVVDTHDEFTAFVTKTLYSASDILSIEIMSGLAMYKNQFLLKRDFK